MYDAITVLWNVYGSYIFQMEYEETLCYRAVLRKVCGSYKVVMDNGWNYIPTLLVYTFRKLIELLYLVHHYPSIFQRDYVKILFILSLEPLYTLGMVMRLMHKKTRGDNYVKILILIYIALMLFLFVLRVQFITDKITNSLMVLVIVVYMNFKMFVWLPTYTSVLQLRLPDTPSVLESGSVSGPIWHIVYLI